MAKNKIKKKEIWENFIVGEIVVIKRTNKSQKIEEIRGQ